MLILQIAVGIVLGGILLAYLGDIILLGLGALVVIIVLAVLALAGVFLYQSISALTVIQTIVVLTALFLIIKWNTKDERIKKALKAQIQKRKDLGYDTTTLRERLEKIEAEEAKKAIKDKEDTALKIANREKNKSVGKVSGKSLAKEQARRRTLGYED